MGCHAVNGIFYLLGAELSLSSGPFSLSKNRKKKDGK